MAKIWKKRTMLVRKWQEIQAVPRRTASSVNHQQSLRNSDSRKLEGTWGISGIEMFMTLQRLYGTDPNDPRNAVPISGSPGKYKVSFLLSKPGLAPLKENHISFDDDIAGDSQISVKVTIEGPCQTETI